jgi:hypothetical protein
MSFVFRYLCHSKKKLMDQILLEHERLCKIMQDYDQMSPVQGQKVLLQLQF